MSLKLDAIGYWSEVKLDIVREYAQAYSTNLTANGLYHVYIDAFAGAGKHVSKDTGELVSGSPEVALAVSPPFDEYYFIDIDSAKVVELEKLSIGHPNVRVYEGDCNSKLLTEVFPRVGWRDYRRGLCLLDPYGLHLNWEVIHKAGEMKSIDMFLNFPVMDMNRNVFWRNPEGVDQADIQRMNSFWGDESWRKVAYRRDPDLFGGEGVTRENISAVAREFRKRLKEVAGFAHVATPMPMRNSVGAIVYYLFFASQKEVAGNIIRDIFRKYSTRKFDNGTLFSH